MRKPIFALLPTLALGLAACSPAAEQNLSNSLARTGDSIDNAADGLGERLDKGADQAGAAIDNFAEDAGNRAEQVGAAIDGKRVAHDDWVGRWRGVEGLNLVISKGKEAGTYRLAMQYSLDDKGTFDGKGTTQGIAFTRPDGDQLLRATDGEATGLKYLAGKKDCLTVKAGEGYCRD
jgi:hypothetical protein